MNIDFKFLLRTGLVVIVIIAIYLGIGYFLTGLVSLDQLLELVKSSGPWAPLVFIALFVCIPGVPTSGLAIASGALFGLWWGLLYTMIGASLAMIMPFWLARLLGRKPLEKLLSRIGGKLEGNVEMFQLSVEKHGWRYVAFCRLIPLFPFSLLNMVFGLTRINFWTYLVTSIIFILPVKFVFVYIGYAGVQAIDGGGFWLYFRIFLAFGGLILLAFLPQIIRFVKARFGKK